MADANDILTLDEARAALNMPTSDQDAKIEALVTGISGRIDALVGPVVQRTVTAERHNGGGNYVVPRQTPVASVTTVTEYVAGAANALTAESISSLPANAYLVDDTWTHRPKIFRRETGSDARFPAGRQNVALTYEAGRAADTEAVPERYKEAARAVLRRIWKREQSAWGRSAAFQGDDGQGTSPAFFRAFDPVIQEHLADQLKIGVA